MIDLDAIEARANAATQGPWPGWNYMTPADYEFHSHAREDIPALVAEVRRLREALDICRENADYMRRAIHESVTI